jgi:hypothetical protein
MFCCLLIMEPGSTWGRMKKKTMQTWRCACRRGQSNAQYRACVGSLPC